ncbi:MAG TPA: hypothetical protein VEU50_07365 [Archangium sp.]|nr:hypothetical protein [Archangium sp.]
MEIADACPSPQDAAQTDALLAAVEGTMKIVHEVPEMPKAVSQPLAFSLAHARETSEDGRMLLDAYRALGDAANERQYFTESAMQSTDNKYLASFKNKAGLEFHLFWSKWLEPRAADYRRYHVVAKRAPRDDDDQKHLNFLVMIMKAAYPQEEAAFALLKADVLR